MGEDKVQRWGELMALLFHAIGNYSVMFHSKKKLRVGAHCGGKEVRRYSDPPQAENPASRIFFDTVNEVKQQGKPAKYERRF